MSTPTSGSSSKMLRKRQGWRCMRRRNGKWRNGAEPKGRQMVKRLRAAIANDEPRPSEGAWLHAKQRALERLGLRFNNDDLRAIADEITEGRAEFVGRGAD